MSITDRTPDLTTPKLKVWAAKPSGDEHEAIKQQALLVIDAPEEEPYESRVYNVGGGYLFKVLAKIRLADSRVLWKAKLQRPDGGSAFEVGGNHDWLTEEGYRSDVEMLDTITAVMGSFHDATELAKHPTIVDRATFKMTLGEARA